jgi:hypothetical protein
MPFGNVYPAYITKIEKKGRTKAELHQVISWLTGYSDKEIESIIKDKTNFRDFFAKAKLNPNSSQISGTICGVKIAEIEDPLMKQIRYLDKLVDELAKGRPMEKILRS